MTFQTARRPAWPVLLALVLVLATACADDGEEGTTGPTATPPPAENGADGDGEDGNDGRIDGDAVEITLVADNNLFDQEELVVPAGASVTLELQNQDSVPHNFALYESEAAEENIFVGETFSGPDESMTYEFTAPDEPGTYFFRCDVHPVTMVGDFVVE